MATPTATISLSSGDIADNSFYISNTSTLYTAGTNTGITETTGLGRKKVATTGNVVLLDGGLTSGVAADVTADKSAKVYIKNHIKNECGYYSGFRRFRIGFRIYMK